MRNFKQKNKPLALLMAVLMMLSIFTVLGTSTAFAADTQTLYLKPNSNWASNARFAVYLSGGTSSATWVSMTSEGDGLYKAEFTGNFKKVTFARMNASKTENSWGNMYNSSASQTIPTNGNNCFTVDAGQWSSATGTWSTYAPVTAATTLYLKPNSNWASNARFAVYLSGGTSAAKWVSMTSAGNGLYKADITGNFKKVTFARMNPNKTENSWANMYNSSAAQTIPTNGNNCFTVDAGQWSSATGTWSTYAPVVAASTLYLKPNSNWASNARFAVYLSGGTSAATWVSMTSAGNGYYKADITGDYTKVTFARMNPNKTENSWANMYNSSAAQAIPTNGNNCFTVDAGQWSSATGTWSKYASVSTDSALYLKPNSNWASNARFAVYLSGGTSAAKWVSMTSAGNGLYKADITGDYTKVVFVRMNPNKPENSWANQYNKSATQTIPTNGNNCFTIDAGQWSNATGTWSKYGSPTEATAIIHFVDDNDREPVVAKVGDTVKYDIYLKLTAAQVQSYSAFTYFNQPVGTKKTSNQEGIVDTNNNVLQVTKSNYTPYYTGFDSNRDLYIQDSMLVSFGMGTMNSDLSYNMLKTNNGSFTQNGGCLVSSITFTVANPGEVEVFTRMAEAIVDLDNGEKRAEYVAVYNEKVATNTKTIYFDPNKNWDSNARFAMYLAGGTSEAKWVSMTSAGNGLYKAELPEGDYKTVIFARMNPNKADNAWGNMYNKSATITLPTNSNNTFVMTEGLWSNATGTWK